MKIELKSIKVISSMSEETNCFTATLVVDGKKIAECRNHGRGGSTDIYPLVGCQSQLKVVEEYAKTLPPFEGYERLGMNLEMLVDDLVEKHLDEQFKIKKRKKIEKWMLDKIIIADKPIDDLADLTSYRERKFIKPISEIIKISPEFLKISIQKIKDQLKPGEVILNTNLKDFL